MMRGSEIARRCATIHNNVSAPHPRTTIQRTIGITIETNARSSAAIARVRSLTLTEASALIVEKKIRFAEDQAVGRDEECVDDVPDGVADRSHRLKPRHRPGDPLARTNLKGERTAILRVDAGLAGAEALRGRFHRGPQ